MRLLRYGGVSAEVSAHEHTDRGQIDIACRCLSEQIVRDASAEEIPQLTTVKTESSSSSIKRTVEDKGVRARATECRRPARDVSKLHLERHVAILYDPTELV
jgi:hypothetical protein